MYRITLFSKDQSEKVSRKHIPEEILELLKGFFHAGNAHKSKRYSTKEKLDELQKKAEMDDLEETDISGLKPIENWI
ncbi:10675_t:CDS:2, partial [Funneliformis mosseae]